MTWYIEMGEDLQRDKRVEFTFYRSLDMDYTPDELIFVDDLIQSDEMEQPKYPDSTQGTFLNFILIHDRHFPLYRCELTLYRHHKD